MPETKHPNLAMMQRLDIGNIDACAVLFSDNFVWHYFNSKRPELAGDYQGIDGLKHFFAKLDKNSTATFQVNPVDARAVGEELVVVHARNRLGLPEMEGGPIEFDAVVVWRIVDGKIAEAWDIPAVNTVRPANLQEGHN